MSWNNLSMKERSSYIRMGVENGVTDLDTIREVYNKFAEGGNLNVNDSPEKRIYDHDKGVYYVEGQDAPNNLKYSLDEFTQEQINEINSKYNKGWKTDRKGNVIFNKYTGTPLNTNLRKSFANKEVYEHYTQEKPTPVGTKYKSNPSIVKAEDMFKTVVRAMQRDSVDNSEDVVKRRNEEARKRYERTQQQNKEYNEEYKHRAGQFIDALALTSALGAIGTQIGASNAANKAMRVGMSTPEYNKLMGMSKNLDTANTIFEGIGMPIDIYQAEEGFANNNMKQALTNTYSALTPISKLIKVSNPKYYWLKPAISFTGNLMEPLSKIFKEGGPIKKSYKDFSTRLSKAWNNQDLNKDHYDYQKYYNDSPEEAYRQLEFIEHGSKGHFPDGGKSGTYKTLNHPTYPDLGFNSWLNNDKLFNMSYRQANQGIDNIREEINTDRILDYLGSDLYYNNGATKAMYDGAYQLPSVTVTPGGNYTELVPNELNTGWMYKDRAGRFNDIDYGYLDKYLGNKKSLGGNLYGDGGDNTPLKYELSTDVNVSPKQQAERLVSLGNGVYRDKISNKLLYNYDEMPTVEVVGHKKKKSINDNLQAAYAKGIPSGTMSADMETMNAVTGGVMNLLSPSQLVGAAIHSDRPSDYFLNLMKDSNGIVTDKFAQEHPYWSMAANGAFDAFAGRTLYNINYWNQKAPLSTAILKGIGKTAIEIPYHTINNSKDYIRDIIHPIETIRAIRDNRYTPLFFTTSKAKEALTKNRKKLQSTFDSAYEFNKKIEFNKAQPVDVEKQYEININNYNTTGNITDFKDAPFKNTKPILYVDPLKDDVGQRFYGNEGYYRFNDVHIPSRTSKHILIDANSNNTKRLLAHEINHHIQDVIPRYRTIDRLDRNVGYYAVNEDNNLANEIFAPIKKNSLKKKTRWSGSPHEVQSEVAGLKYELNNPSNYINQPQKNKDFIRDYISKRFYISKDEADKMLNDMSKNSFAIGGYIHK